MSELPDGFDMFPKPDAGFSKSYVEEFRKVFEERIELIMNTLSTDLGFIDLSSSDYEKTKAYMKNEVEAIGHIYFHLIKDEEKFVNQQEIKVNKLCGFKPRGVHEKLPAFVNAYKYEPEITKSLREFVVHYDQSLKEIELMATHDNLDESLYNDYKTKLVDHIKAMDAQDLISVNLIIKQHFEDNTESVLGRLPETWETQKSSVEKKLTEVEAYYQGILVEIEDKEDKLKVMKQKFFNPDTTVTSKENFIEEVNNLKISETRVKHNKQYSEWKDTINNFKQTSKELYESYVSLNSLQVGCLVDPTEIEKPSMSLEAEEQTKLWTCQLHEILQRCTKLAKEEMRTKEKISELDEE